MQILPSEDIHAFLEAAKARDLLPMFYLELVSGLRKGELAALRWDDLDIQSKTISVSKQYVRNPDDSLELTRPKTENSVRMISIPQTAVELLIQEHDKHPNSPYLFPSPITGEMYHPDSVVNLHKKILKDAGLPHIRFHDLPHTFATTALQNGVDVKTVFNMLGHYDAGFTLRTYTDATRQKQDEAACGSRCGARFFQYTKSSFLATKNTRNPKISGVFCQVAPIRIFFLVRISCYSSLILAKRR